MANEYVIGRIAGRREVTELTCDICGKHLGWLSEFAMNGNYIVCDDCVPEGVKKVSDVQNQL